MSNIIHRYKNMSLNLDDVKIDVKHREVNLGAINGRAVIVPLDQFRANFSSKPFEADVDTREWLIAQGLLAPEEPVSASVPA